MCNMGAPCFSCFVWDGWCKKRKKWVCLKARSVNGLHFLNTQLIVLLHCGFRFATVLPPGSLCGAHLVLGRTNHSKLLQQRRYFSSAVLPIEPALIWENKLSQMMRPAFERETRTREIWVSLSSHRARVQGQSLHFVFKYAFWLQTTLIQADGSFQPLFEIMFSEKKIQKKKKISTIKVLNYLHL